MITPDERVECIERMKNAHQSLQLLQDLQNGSSEDPAFGKTVCSLLEGMISKIASSYDLDSDVRAAAEERRSVVKKRKDRIQELETLISQGADWTKFKETVKEVRKRVNIIWNNEGFKSSINLFIRETGKIDVTLYLEPLRESWDLEEENDEEFLPDFYKHAFSEKGFQTIEEEGYCYLKDNDYNREIIKGLLLKNFPTFKIWDWKFGYSKEEMVLNSVNLTISDITCLEDSK